MTAHTPRLFPTSEAVRHVGEGLLACTLPRAGWTHEAHLASCLWLARERPDILLSRELPDIIRSYNASVGGVNSDTDGYHETITQAYIRLICDWLAQHDRDESLVDLVNRLLNSPIGGRDMLLRHWSADRLFSTEARAHWLEPDIAPLSAGVQQPQRVS